MRGACLNTAGRGAMSPTQAARIRRTRFWARDRVGFMATLVGELERHERRATARDASGRATQRAERPPVGTLPGQRGGEEFPHIFAAFPAITFYDYTKWPSISGRSWQDIPNYSLTFSLAEDNDATRRRRWRPASTWPSSSLASCPRASAWPASRRP
jgi:hypothetical protein